MTFGIIVAVLMISYGYLFVVSKGMEKEAQMLSTTELELLLTNEELYRAFSNLYIASSSYVITADETYSTQFNELLDDIAEQTNYLNSFGTNEERDALIDAGGQWIASVQQDVFPLVTTDNSSSAVA